MKQLTLILARHGNTFEAGETPLYVGCRTDLPLTEAGRAQAQKAAIYLRSAGLIPSLIYCGNLLRQKETAGIIADKLQLQGKSIIKSDQLIEVDYGDWEGLSAKEIETKYPVEFDDWTKRGIWPEHIFGSTEQNFFEPIKEWLVSVSKQQEDCILAVTSNGTLRYIHKLCSNGAVKPPEEVKVRTGGICIVQITNGKSEIVRWNDNP